MKKFIVASLFAVALLGLNGCVIWHSRTLTTIHDDTYLEFTTTGAGLLPGMCGFYFGKTTETSGIIVLHGTKEKYTETDFEILNADGTRRGKSEQTTGTITIERRKKIVHIDVRMRGEPFELNGRHRYK